MADTNNFLWDRVLCSNVATLDANEMPSLKAERLHLLALGYRLIDARRSVHDALASLAGEEWRDVVGQTRKIDVEPMLYDETAEGCAQLAFAISHVYSRGLFFALADDAGGHAFKSAIESRAPVTGVRFVFVR